MRTRLDNFGTVNSESIIKKHKEIIDICNAIDDLINAHNKFMSEHVFFSDSKDTVKNLLAYFKKLCNDKERLNKIKELEKELNAMKKAPDNSADLFAALTRISRIKTSIPQIKAMLNKATTLKKIAEKVDANFAKNFDKIIKDIEAADNVEKVVFTVNNLINKENELKDLMRTKINEANKMAHILHEIAKIFGLNQLKGKFVDLIDTFERFNYGGAPIAELYKVYQDVETVNIAENELKNYLGEQIDNLAKQANELKDQANGVDDDLKKSFEDTATNLQTEKENLLKNLAHAAKIVSDVRESLAERQGDLIPKLALKKQIPTLKEQATKLKDMAESGGYKDFIITFNMILADINNFDSNNVSEENNRTLNKIKWRLNRVAKTFASKEIDALLEQKVMGAEIQDELNAIKAGLPKADEANADTVVKAFDDVKAVKTKMANKLLEWHKVLSEYHTEGYHKKGVEEVQSLVEINLETLKGGADKMLAGADAVELNAENLNSFAKIALKIAENLRTDIADVINRVKNYIGFGEFDFTAGTQANTLVTFLKDKVDNVSDLKFVDKKTRATLAKDIKHIFDQIKIDQKTGEYYLPGFYNRYAVTQDDLKLICEAYDVVAEDFGERSSYVLYNESSKEGTNLEKATYLSRTLHEVQRLDLLDVSPESREALKKDIMEIGAKIKSTPGWIYGRTLSLEGVSQKETKDMQDGLAGILEFYNSIQAQTKAQK